MRSSWAHFKAIWSSEIPPGLCWAQRLRSHWGSADAELCNLQGAQAVTIKDCKSLETPVSNLAAASFSSISTHGNWWIFRGQSKRWPLNSSSRYSLKQSDYILRIRFSEHLSKQIALQGEREPNKITSLLSDSKITCCLISSCWQGMLTSRWTYTWR